VEQLLSKRTLEGRGDKVLIFAEAAGALSEHHLFDKGVDLEKWWNDVHMGWIRKRLGSISLSYARIQVAY
jgi:hypothetical protein